MAPAIDCMESIHLILAGPPMRTICLATVLSVIAVSTADAGTYPVKKLIHAGYSGTPAQIRANIRKMEQAPFDGLNISLDWNSDAFIHDRKLADDHYVKEQQDLERTAWKRFTERFIMIKGADSKTDMDWFDDGHWENILHNIRIKTRIARETGCRGLTFDPEQYHTPIWDYRHAPRKDEFTYAQYRAIARRRGAQYVEAVQSIFPDVQILNYFQMTTFAKFYRDEQGTGSDLDALLAKSHYGIYLGFIEGMIEAAGPEVRLIDGNEGAYGLIDRAGFDRAYVDIMQRCLFLIDPALRSKYRQVVRAGSSVYLNHAMGEIRVVGAFLSRDEKTKLIEPNTFHAMDTTDRYAWFYLETTPHSFWRNHLPHGTVEAIRSARRRLAQRRFEGLENPAFARARAALGHYRATAMDSVEPSRAVIRRMPGQARPPKIDGVPDDPIWRTVEPLQSFTVRLQDMSKGLEADTVAKVTWNDDHIFFAFTCTEPSVGTIHSSGGGGRDSDNWRADCLEVFLVPHEGMRPYYQFVVNPKNTQFDRVSKFEDAPADVKWNADFRSGTHIGSDRWTCEMAIPWSAVGGTPKPGERRRANLGRGRSRPNRIREVSSWSPMWEVYADMKYAGVFVFE